MSSKFEDYLANLNNEQYDVIMQERIARLNPEQQAIMQAREVQRKYRFQLIDKLTDPNSTEETHESVFNAIRDMDGDACEHGRSYCKNCIACSEIDHKMFPEIFDEDGELIEPSILHGD